MTHCWSVTADHAAPAVSHASRPHRPSSQSCADDSPPSHQLLSVSMMRMKCPTQTTCHAPALTDAAAAAAESSSLATLVNTCDHVQSLNCVYQLSINHHTTPHHSHTQCTHAPAHIYTKSSPINIMSGILHAVLFCNAATDSILITFIHLRPPGKSQQPRFHF